MFSVRDTHLNDSTGYKCWLLAEQSSYQTLTWTGKAIQVQQHWRQEHDEGLGWHELKDPSQPMLLSQEKQTPSDCRTPVQQPCW